MADNDPVNFTEVKREPKSPATLDSYNTYMDNGFHGAVTSEGESSQDASSYDAPLDFSMKKRPAEDDVQKEARKCPRIHEPRPMPPPQPPQFSPGSEVQVNGTVSPQSGGSENDRTEPGEVVKIGEPQTALPGTLPGTVLPAVSGMTPSMFPGLMGTFPFIIDPQTLRVTAQNTGSGSSKSTRPFKAYPKDPLSLPLGYYGIPGIMPPSLESLTVTNAATSADELFNQYRMYVLKAQEEAHKQGVVKSGTNNYHRNNNNNHHHSQLQQQHPPSQAPLSTTSSASNSPSAPTSGPTSPTISTSTPGTEPVISRGAGSRKQPRTLPEEQKDEAYWERRRKNNDAAKRSRDARRAKEDEIAIRAALLEQENLKLRVEVAALKNETAKLRCMLYNS